MRCSALIGQFLLAGALLLTSLPGAAWAQNDYPSEGPERGYDAPRYRDPRHDDRRDPRYDDRRDDSRYDDRRRDDRRDDSRRDDNRNRGLSRSEIVAAQERYNRNVVSLQTQYNQGVVALQHQFNQHQISRPQLDGGIRQLQRQMNDRIGQEQRALPH